MKKQPKKLYLNVIFRYTASGYMRYEIAYLNDVIEGEKTNKDWDKKPRMATNKEVRDWIDQEIINGSLRLGDQGPTLGFKSDGTLDREVDLDQATYVWEEEDKDF